MTFVESIKTCLSKYATWKGRATRSEYWYFVLFGFICYAAAAVIDNIFGITFKMTDPSNGLVHNFGYGYVYVLVAIFLFIPAISAMVRRLHDTDHSGWWYWVALIPLIGTIALLIWFCSRGTDGYNSYGNDPFDGDLGQVFS